MTKDISLASAYYKNRDIITNGYVSDDQHMAAVLNDPLLNRNTGFCLLMAACSFRWTNSTPLGTEKAESSGANRDSSKRTEFSATRVFIRKINKSMGAALAGRWGTNLLATGARPITPGLRDWRKQMAPRDVERFEAVAGESLDHLGYPRGANDLRTEILKQAAGVRARFEGRPLPRGWEAVSVV